MEFITDNNQNTVWKNLLQVIDRETNLIYVKKKC